MNHPSQSLAKFIAAAGAGTAFVSAFVFNWNFLGIQFPLLVTAFLASILASAGLVNKKVDPYVLALAAAAVVLSCFTAVRDSDGLNFFTIVTVLFASSLVVYEQVDTAKLGLKTYFLWSWLLPIFSIFSFPEMVGNLKLKVFGKLRPQQARALRGVLLAVPLLLIFGLLFASADAVFASIFKNIFDIDLSLDGSFIVRSIAFFVLWLVVSGSLTYAFISKHSKTKLAAQDDTKTKNYNVELAIVLGSLNALFALFLIIQLVYLFGGQQVVLDGDMTYAEYGRKGFFELVAVSALVFPIVFFARKFAGAATKSTNKLLLIALVVQVGVVMLSALKRLSLYEEVYGFTLLRFYSHSFVFFLAIAFIILLYAVVKNSLEPLLLRALFMSVIGYIIVLNLVGPDAFVAKQNLDRYKVTGKLDAWHMLTLSNDAVDQKIETWEIAKVNTDGNVSGAMQADCDMDFDIRTSKQEKSTGRHWSTWNLQRERAYSKLKDLNTQCESYKSLFE